MDAEHGKRGRILTCALVAVAVTWAGAVASAWPASGAMATGLRQPGAWHAPAVGAARPAGSWGRAIEVPGLGALNKGGNAEVRSVSCASAGNCAAGGSYTGRLGHGQGFVASERNGRWGTAIKVPGLEAMNKGNAGVWSVSCASAGNCAAGGQYIDRSYNTQVFVAVERNGVWGTAVEVPGLGALNEGGNAFLASVSCAPAGTCAAGGSYADRHYHSQAFVVSQACCGSTRTRPALRQSNGI